MKFQQFELDCLMQEMQSDYNTGQPQGAQNDNVPNIAPRESPKAVQPYRVMPATAQQAADYPYLNGQVVMDELAVGSTKTQHNKLTAAKIVEHDVETVNHQAEVVSLIWDRDSHGLFDYESRQLEESKMNHAGCAQVVRDKYQVGAVMPFKDDEELPSNSAENQKLFSLVYKQGLYWIYHCRSMYRKDKPFDQLSGTEFPHTDQVWQVIRLQNIPDEKVLLTESPVQMQDRNKKWKSPENLVTVRLGDTVKFGRVRFKVRELAIESVLDEFEDPASARAYESEHQLQPKAPGTAGRESARTHPDLGATGHFGGAMARAATSMSMGSEMNDLADGDAAANFSFEPRLPGMREEAKDKCPTSYNDKAGLANVKSESAICRICLSEEELPHHQLLTPCACAGGMGYIGASCLREWLEGKKHKKEMPYVNSYIWKGLECEICKTPFKDTYTKPDGTTGELLNFKRYPGCNNYMIIESVTNTTSKTIHVMNFDVVPDVRVGRAQYVEVRITDISVSRYHACLTLQKDLRIVTIEDNFSKFGTLKLVTQPLAVGPSNAGQKIADKMIVPVQEALYLQIGRCLVGIRSHTCNKSIMQKLTSCLASCMGKKPQNRKNEISKENLLHFEEAISNFPKEYLEYFAHLSLIDSTIFGAQGIYVKSMQFAKSGKHAQQDSLVIQNTQDIENSYIQGNSIAGENHGGQDSGSDSDSYGENPLEMQDRNRMQQPEPMPAARIHGGNYSSSEQQSISEERNISDDSGSGSEEQSEEEEEKQSSDEEEGEEEFEEIANINQHLEGSISQQSQQDQDDNEMAGNIPFRELELEGIHNARQMQTPLDHALPLQQQMGNLEPSQSQKTFDLKQASVNPTNVAFESRLSNYPDQRGQVKILPLQTVALELQAQLDAVDLNNGLETFPESKKDNVLAARNLDHGGGILMEEESEDEADKPDNQILPEEQLPSRNAALTPAQNELDTTCRPALLLQEESSEGERPQEENNSQAVHRGDHDLSTIN